MHSSALRPAPSDAPRGRGSLRSVLGPQKVRGQPLAHTPAVPAALSRPAILVHAICRQLALHTPITITEFTNSAISACSSRNARAVTATWPPTATLGRLRCLQPGSQAEAAARVARPSTAQAGSRQLSGSAATHGSAAALASSVAPDSRAAVNCKSPYACGAQLERRHPSCWQSRGPALSTLGQRRRSSVRPQRAARPRCLQRPAPGAVGSLWRSWRLGLRGRARRRRPRVGPAAEALRARQRRRRRPPAGQRAQPPAHHQRVGAHAVHAAQAVGAHEVARACARACARARRRARLTALRMARAPRAASGTPAAA
jgi:hypothetical protein